MKAMTHIGYVVLAKRPDRNDPTVFVHEAAGSVWPELDPVENHQVYCQLTAEANPERYPNVEYVIGVISTLDSENPTYWQARALKAEAALDRIGSISSMSNDEVLIALDGPLANVKR